MKKFAKHNALWLIGLVFGSIAGYFYWKFVGCSSGTCAITSNPINSTLYGAVMGGLFFSLFKKQQHDISRNH